MAVPPKICVIDTNALLNDPDVINSFSGAEVVVPAAVLKELDDLKRRRTDPRVRYNGRKATRMLFDASKHGRLVDGVRLPNGSLLRVDVTERFDDLPAGLDPSRTDDLILALAYTYDQRPGTHGVVVTNDLNMLLRAETLGLGTYRFEGKLDVRKRRRRTPTEWLRDEWLTAALAVLVVVFAASSAYLYTSRDDESTSATDLTNLDSFTLLQLGVSPDVLERSYRDRLERDPADYLALTNLANLLQDTGRYLESLDFYQQALRIRPTDAAVRTDMGIALLRVGHQREAVQAFRQAVADDPQDAIAHYNLGVALALQNDRSEALAQLQIAISLSQQTGGGIPIADAQLLIDELSKGGLGTPTTTTATP